MNLLSNEPGDATATQEIDMTSLVGRWSEVNAGRRRRERNSGEINKPLAVTAQLALNVNRNCDSSHSGRLKHDGRRMLCSATSMYSNALLCLHYNVVVTGARNDVIGPTTARHCVLAGIRWMSWTVAVLRVMLTTHWLRQLIASSHEGTVVLTVSKL